MSCPVVACRAKSEAEIDTQSTIFDLSALKKQLLIFYLFDGLDREWFYQHIFEIEEKDEAYLRYEALYPFRGRIENEINSIEKRQQHGPDEDKQFEELYEKKQLGMITESKRFAPQEQPLTSQEEKTFHRLY